MTVLTKKESEALLIVFKDFSIDYNANSISKVLNITPRGALKVLKSLKLRNLLRSKKFGKASFYKVNFEDEYAIKTIETLLIQESRENGDRWVTEFKNLFKIAQIVILFGSMTRTPQTAKDVDVVIVVSQKNFEAAKKFVAERNTILLKPIHPVYQSPSDIKDNLKERQAVMLNALRDSFVLCGQDKLIGVVKYATSF